MLCVIAIIDSAATERLTKLRRTAERFGIPPRIVHGHITLASYIGADEEGFAASCKAILSGYGKFPVYYDKIETWASTSGVKSLIVAVPRREPVLAALQKEISGGWTADLNRWTKEDAWNPHTSLLYVPGTDLSAAAGAMGREFEPFAAQVDRIELTHVYENEGKSSIEIIDFIELEQADGY